MNINDIQLLLLDVDGVLTDGSLLIDETGRTVQRFNIKDGMGIRAWQQCGLEVALLSARSSRLPPASQRLPEASLRQPCSAWI